VQYSSVLVLFRVIDSVACFRSLIHEFGPGPHCGVVERLLNDYFFVTCLSGYIFMVLLLLMALLLEQCRNVLTNTVIDVVEHFLLEDC
jgi:hypothetical protein